MELLYFLIAICACVVGALTGMGGGVFMKPILDLLGQFDASSINMVSSITVFCMAAVSVLRQRGGPERPTAKVAVPLAVGAVIGGGLGSRLFKKLAAQADAAQTTLVQNVILAVIVVLIFLYMQNKDKLPSPRWDGVLPGALAGTLLGVISSFLGIGGGPVNVSLIIFCFGYSTKQAALCSLITILFSQAAKIAPAVITGQIARNDLTALPFMVTGAIAGGLIGSAGSRKVSAKHADKLFNAAQIMIFMICAVNIVRSSGLL